MSASAEALPKFDASDSGSFVPSLSQIKYALNVDDGDDDLKLAALEALSMRVDRVSGEEAAQFCDELRASGLLTPLVEMLDHTPEMSPEMSPEISPEIVSEIHVEVLYVLANIGSDAYDRNSLLTKQLLRTDHAFARLVPHIFSDDLDTQHYTLGAMQNLCTFTDYARLLQTFGVVERIRELEISTRNDQIRQYAQGCLRNMQMMETMVSPRKEQPNSSLCVDDEHGGEDGGNLSKKKDSRSLSDSRIGLGRRIRSALGSTKKKAEKNGKNHNQKKTSPQQDDTPSTSSNRNDEIEFQTELHRMVDGSLGIQLSSRNRVIGILNPRSDLEVGDLIVAVDGVDLAKSRLFDVIKLGAPSYVLRAVRKIRSPSKARKSELRQSHASTDSPHGKRESRYSVTNVDPELVSVFLQSMNRHRRLRQIEREETEVRAIISELEAAAAAETSGAQVHGSPIKSRKATNASDGISGLGSDEVQQPQANTLDRASATRDPGIASKAHTSVAAHPRGALSASPPPSCNQAADSAVPSKCHAPAGPFSVQSDPPPSPSKCGPRIAESSAANFPTNSDGNVTVRNRAARTSSRTATAHALHWLSQTEEAAMKQQQNGEPRIAAESYQDHPSIPPSARMPIIGRM